MVAITGTNSLASLITIIGMIWYIISACLLLRYYKQNYAKSIKSRIFRNYIAIFYIGKLIFVNSIKDDGKLDRLIWHTRISLVGIILGIILTLI
jgi:hypothetical protein